MGVRDELSLDPEQMTIRDIESVIAGRLGRTHAKTLIHKMKQLARAEAKTTGRPVIKQLSRIAARY